VGGKNGKKWNKHYEKLVEFERKHGNCLVPTSTYQEDASLGKWVDKQRTLHYKNTIRLDRKVLLDEIGFVWRVDKSKTWHQQYEKLVEFKRKNGHCLVPKRYQEDMPFANWADTQRQLHNRNTIRHDRKGLLDEIGFVWSVAKSAQWNKQYGKLVEFKRKHGNFLVPSWYQEDASLGNWVITQRTAHTNNNMPLDRKGLLDEIGFVWRVDNDAPWNKQYGKLVEFKQKNGHCLVPNKYKEDKSLGIWVCKQRQLHIKNKIRSDRKGLLEELGFAWKADKVAARSSTTHVSYR
jgi:hypothetical protein